MHITERLGLYAGRPVTCQESEILRAFERLFIEEDFLFLTNGPTITLTSDFATTIIGVRETDQGGALVQLVMVPSSALPAGQVKAVVAAASAENEGERKLLIIERAGQPLMLVSEEYVPKPYRRDVLNSVFFGFVRKTDVALGEVVQAAGGRERRRGLRVCFALPPCLVTDGSRMRLLVSAGGDIYLSRCAVRFEAGMGTVRTLREGSPAQWQFTGVYGFFAEFSGRHAGSDRARG